MNEHAAQRPGWAEGAQAAQELYRLYREFMADSARERGHDYPWREYADFAAWWQRLPPAVRQHLERDFRRGYAAVVADGERQVAAALDRRDEPGAAAD
jgi:hypothetical protein